MKKINLLYTALALLFVVTLTLSYFEYLTAKKDELRNFEYSLETKNIQKDFKNLIRLKEKSILSIAIALSDDATLRDDLKKDYISPDKYQKILYMLQKDTDYKNIWIQIVDAKAISLYRSWTDEKGDYLGLLRSDIQNVSEKKDSFTSVSVGRYDLSIKAIVPIIDKGVVLGAIEVISHFNSISKYMSRSNFDALFVLEAKYKKQLKYPFSKLFIQDKYYVANLDAKKEFMRYISEHGVQNYFNSDYKVEKEYLIVSIPIKGADETILGYAILFKKVQSILDNESRFFMYKYISLFVILVLSFTILSTILLLFANKKQKSYYRNILDSTTNIILVINNSKIKYVNELFFKYFTKNGTLEEFYENNSCICKQFIKEEGFIEENMHGVNWLEYLRANEHKVNKVKIDIEGIVYIFSITASVLKDTDDETVVVLSDITSQEEFLSISLTDDLTKIGNRRYFNNKLLKEMSLAKRHGHKLSLIMFDIDFFKKVNDTYGHKVGDDVLIQYAQLISEELRREDLVFRVGGEEFMIVLPETSMKSAQIIAEKLRKMVEESRIVVPITMSFGVVEYRKGETEDLLYKRVDSALYASKENGRNRVTVG